MAKRLWEKGDDLNRQVHAFTVGDDPEIDLELVRSDLIGSAAHVKMLAAVKLISEDECRSLLAGLQKLLKLESDNKFTIAAELEDCHTAIEMELIDDIGAVGGKVHTGRSRNDQVLVAMRLYLREQVIEACTTLLECAETFFVRAETCGHQPMPGYTHMQPAMPSSVQLWLQAFGESVLSLCREGVLLLDVIDQNPLGAASGFGTNLPIDRNLTTKFLGFSRVQRNPIAVQNSRGQSELRVLRWSSDVAALIEKFSWDLILYSTREFGFFSLPTSLTTGSSIMPQKKNPDVLELLRARTAKIRGAENELTWVLAKLPSNYHRDFQYTKEPLVRGVRHLHEMLPIVREVISTFSVNKTRLDDAMTADLYATYAAYRQVKSGVAFREAYGKTAELIKRGEIKREEFEKDFKWIADAADAELAEAKAELSALAGEVGKWAKKLEDVEKSVFTV